MILISLHTNSSSMFHAVCLQIVPAKMENPDNEDIIIQIEEMLFGQRNRWRKELGTAMPYGCNDNIKGVGNLSSPGCNEINVMSPF